MPQIKAQESSSSSTKSLTTEKSSFKAPFSLSLSENENVKK